MRQRSLPTFHPTFDMSEPPDLEAEKRWRGRFWAGLREAEREFGTGPTYPEEWRRLILEGIVPEWVFRGIMFGKTRTLKTRCEKARLALERLHKEFSDA